MTGEDDGLPPCPSPRLGPCGICGWHPDQRHRVRDTILSRLLAGEPAGDVANDYGWTPDEIMALHLDIDANLVDMIHKKPSV